MSFYHGCLDTAFVLHCRFVLLRRIDLFATTEELVFKRQRKNEKTQFSLIFFPTYSVTSSAETYKFSSATAYTLKHNCGV